MENVYSRCAWSEVFCNTLRAMKKWKQLHGSSSKLNNNTTVFSLLLLFSCGHSSLQTAISADVSTKKTSWLQHYGSNWQLHNNNGDGDNKRAQLEEKLFKNRQKQREKTKRNFRGIVLMLFVLDEFGFFFSLLFLFLFGFPVSILIGLHTNDHNTQQTHMHRILKVSLKCDVAM